MNFKEHLKKYLKDEEIEDLLLALTKERTNSLLINKNKINDEDLLKLYPNLIKFNLIDHVYFFDKEEYSLGKSYLFDNGAYYIMDTASMITTKFLTHLKDHSLVLDLCAAPGGKTISLALNNPNIHILSNDLSYSRALTLSSNIEKLGLSNVTVISTDFHKHYQDFKEKFDYIILDAPCSGSAMFRKLEEMENDWTYEKVLKCALIQKELTEIAYLMLKKGGTLVYSTCSFSYEEDEEIILSLLNKHSDLSLINLNDDPSFYHSNLKETIHLLPNKFKGEGQFIAYLKKDGELSENKMEINKNQYKIPSEIKNYSLNFNNYELINNSLYGYNYSFNTKGISVLRKGVYIGDIDKNIFKPSFALAHYLPNKKTIELSDDEAKKYLHGETFLIKNNLKNGYYIVSFNKINLGFIKLVNQVAKNLYPKGLRH